MEQLVEFITNHLLLWIALAAILVLILINEWIGQKRKAKELSTAEAVKLINHEDAQVIDLRDAEAFKAGHIINAIRADASDFEKERLKKFQKNPIILICARGLHSPTTATKLREQGFEQVYVLSGGMNAWVTADLPVVKK